MVDTLNERAWVRRIVQDIVESNMADVVLVVVNAAKTEQSLVQKVAANRQHLLYGVYTVLDRKINHQKHDAFARADLTATLPDVPVLPVTPRMTKFSDYVNDADFDTIRGYDLDVMIRFGFRILRGEILNVARFGVWSYHHGDNLVNRGSPAGFWEVMEGDPVTGSVLQILSSQLDAGQVIYRSYAKTLPLSVERNKNNFYWKTSAFVMRKLHDLYHHGEASLTDPLDDTYRPYSKAIYVKPTNLQMLGYGAKLATRTASLAVSRALTRQQWALFYRFHKDTDPYPSAFYNFKRIQPPKDRYWADPFPVKRDGRFVIYVEEWLYSKGRGHIAAIELDEDGNHRNLGVVLDTGYHLSYPFVFEYDGDLFMIPESGSARSVDVYRCVAFPLKWEHEKKLLDGLRAVDATLREIDGRWWMFVNIAEEHTLNYDELHLYHADTPFGEWTAHPRNPVMSDVRSARPAGHLFYHNGKLYRPAQDCSVRYGYALTFNRIDHIDPETYSETVTSKLLPQWHRGLLANHTINRTDTLTVVDGLLRIPRW